MRQIFVLLIISILFVFLVVLPATESKLRVKHRGHRRKHHSKNDRHARADTTPVDYCNRTEYLYLKQSCVETFTKPPVTAKSQADVEWQNRKLLKQFVDNAIESHERNDLTPVAGFLFLNISAGIYKRLCPDPFVPFSYITNMELLFKELHYVTTANQPRTELISVKDTDRTVAVLLQCLNDTAPFNFAPDDCQEEIDTYQGERVCPDLSKDFNAKLYDPLLDAIWHIYETIHAHCFPYFQNDNRMFHVYGYGFIDLFHKDIKQRWANMFETDAFWEHLIGPTWQLISMNMELCTQAVIQNSKFPYRLGRDSLPVQVRLNGFTGTGE